MMIKLKLSKDTLDAIFAIACIFLLILILRNLDIFEWLHQLSRQHEEWELDDIIIGLMISPAFLGWFAFRRWQDATTECSLRQQREHELVHAKQILSYRVAHDLLTGLPNRTLLADRLYRGIIQSQRYRHQLALVYIDLDDFKSINDAHGRKIGDQFLITTANRIKEAVRAMDTVARISGDEFAVMLLELTDRNACLPILNKLLTEIANPINVDGMESQVTASIGVAFYPQKEHVDPDQLLRQADQAMYQSKLQGKGRYHIFDSEQDRTIRGHHESVEHIRNALEHKQFVLFYQPKVNMRSGEVIGSEALIRWHHPDRGLLLPAVFLPVIECHPLAIELGEWVLETVLAQMERWSSHGINISVSVNVTAIQLQQYDFADYLQALLARYPSVRPSDLELEVLETSALEDITEISRVMRLCHELGINFALDDFGTGYSSLTYLKRLPATILKIDKSFVHNMLDDPEDLAIVEGILGLAAAFRRQPIAEGVESVIHGELLLRLDCEFAQGNGIAPPMPASELAGWIDTWKPYPSWSEVPSIRRDDAPFLLSHG